MIREQDRWIHRQTRISAGECLYLSHPGNRNMHDWKRKLFLWHSGRIMLFNRRDRELEQGEWRKATTLLKARNHEAWTNGEPVS